MKSFIVAAGELVSGGLALVHGLKAEADHMNGMIVVTERLAVDGELYKGATVKIGDSIVWLCSGSGVVINFDGALVPSDETFFLAKNLTPIKPEAEPKLITAEREVMA